MSEVVAALRARELSATEAVTRALQRLDVEGRRLNAVVSLLQDRALERARRADARPEGAERLPLLGVPFGAKDIIAVAGAPTTWGLPGYADRVLDQDAAVVTALERAGAICVAKLATDELAGALAAETTDQSLTGPCRNPFDLEMTAGSSSGGPAAAVAAGILPFAIGTETIGSILEPASYCGITGLRPSHRAVPTAGVMPVAPSLDRVGPLAESTAVADRVFGCLAGAGPVAPVARIGVPADWAAEVDPAVAAAFRAALASGGAELVEVVLPPWPTAEAAWLVLVEETVQAHRVLLRDAVPSFFRERDNRAHGAAYLALGDGAARDARKLVPLVVGWFAACFADVDALAYPTTPTGAPPVDAVQAAWIAPHRASWLRSAGALAGLPGVTVPAGVDGRGLPCGLCLVGPHGHERGLLAAADAMHAGTVPTRNRAVTSRILDDEGRRA